MSVSIPQKTVALNSVNFGLGFAGAALIVFGTVITEDRFDVMLSGDTSSELVNNFQIRTSQYTFAPPFSGLTPTRAPVRYNSATGAQIATNASSTTGLKAYKGIGIGLFVLGWIFVAIAACTYFKSTANGKRTIAWNLPMGPVILGTSAVTMGTAGMTQYMLSTTRADQKMERRITMGASIAAWLGMAVAISYKTGKFDIDRFILALFGAICIIASMFILQSSRRFMEPYASFLATKTNSYTNVFNLGIPLFVLGWMLFVIAFSIE